MPPQVAFIASIQGRTHSGCARLRRPPPPLTHICAFFGERIPFHCIRDGGDPMATTPQIRMPGGMIVPGISVIGPVNTTAAGSFECFTSTTQCGEVIRRLRVQVYGEQNH